MTMEQAERLAEIEEMWGRAFTRYGPLGADLVWLIKEVRRSRAELSALVQADAARTCSLQNEVSRLRVLIAGVLRADEDAIEQAGQLAQQWFGDQATGAPVQQSEQRSSSPPGAL
jgi:hypothetical protein